MQQGLLPHSTGRYAYAAHACGMALRGNGCIPPGNPPGGFGGGHADVRLKEAIGGVSFGWSL